MSSMPKPDRRRGGVSPSASTLRKRMAADRARGLAEQQSGRITTAQLRACGFSEARIWRWNQDGRIVRIAQGLYALGHCAPVEDIELRDALLLAGPGAFLCAGTGLWWWGCIRFPPSDIHVSAPGRRRSKPGVRIHHPARLDRAWHRGLPVAPIAEALLGSASMISFAGMRRALAQAEHLELMTLREMNVLSTCGQAGSATVLQALKTHMPELAKTRSPLEDRFLFFCEAYGFPLPRPNFEISGHEVDAVWPELFLAVELDGRKEHGKPGAVVRDRRRELAVRNAGYELIRYGSEQIDHDPGATALDLRAAHERGRRRAC